MTSCNDGECCKGLKRRCRTAAVSVMWSTALAVASATGLPVIAAEVTNAEHRAPLEAHAIFAELIFKPAAAETRPINERGAGDVTPQRVELVEKVDAPGADTAMASHGGPPPPEALAESQVPVNAHPAAGLGLKRVAAGTGLRGPIMERAVEDVNHHQLAQLKLPEVTQFQVPEAKPGMKAPAPKPIPELTFQYAYGSDSEITYLRNPDLNKRVRDNSTIAAPTVFGLAIYRPNAWLEATVEMTLERQIAIQEEKQVRLPSGEIQLADKKRFSLLIDQAYLRFKGDSIEFTVGRKNFEDVRLWLYDAALDSVSVKLKHGNFQTEASVGRENWRDLDLISTAPKGRINYYILHSEYRGIEDHRFAGYAITLRDSLRQEGEPLLLGVRAIGRPTDQFNYWTELAIVRGKDPLNQDYSARAFDVGGTYRFTGFPLNPSVTLGYAYGSGDGNPNDRKNREFRQTGLQSNEARFGGLTQFKAYGETLDPELSNLKIFTLGFGFRPASNAFVDLVYHRYRLDKIGNDLRSSALTALINQDDTQLSKRVGSAFDVILGFRNLFGLKRFGFEMRAGMFFPGHAYRNEGGDPDNPTFRKADKAVSVLAVFIW